MSFLLQPWETLFRNTNTTKRPREDKKTAAAWKMVRLAAKDAAQRRRDGGSLQSPQQKVACESLEVQPPGVIGIQKGGWFVGQRRIVDYNYYRSTGHEGRFAAGTPDRAVMVATTAAYQVLQQALGDKATVEHGDLGENILIDGPPATLNENDGLYVGLQLVLGKYGSAVVIEITEANNPCYRFNTQTWAAAGQRKWGDTAPDDNPKLWFKSPDCPLNHKQNPGIRGWLAKVVKPGTIQVGGAVARNTTTPKTTEEPEEKDDEGTKEESRLPPAKRRRT